MIEDGVLEWRKDNDKVGRARRILADPDAQAMIITVRDANPAIDVPLGSPEVASVRVLSERAGFEKAISTLLSLSVPHSDIPQLGEEDWGAETQTITHQ